MKKILIIGACLLSSVAMAQDKEYTLTVTGTEVGLISEGLQELSVKRAFPLIQKLQTQINVQNASKLETKPEEKKE